MSLSEKIVALGYPSVRFVNFISDKSFQEAWSTCPSGDWMLWLCGKMSDAPGWPERKEIIAIVRKCVELATGSPLTKQSKDGPLKVLERWERDEPEIPAQKRASFCAALAEIVLKEVSRKSPEWLATFAELCRERLVVPKEM